MSGFLVPVLVVASLGLLFGLGLAYASKKFEVKIDERISKISGVLPGANCGACGFSSCEGYAQAVVEEGAAINLCTVGGAEVTASIADIMGVAAGGFEEKKVARVMCQGSWDKVKIKFDYDGIIDCNAASSLSGGPSACSYGCVGMGSCQKVCAFDAITVENGLARIDEEKCTGCEQCVLECPKNIIKMVPANLKYTVLCMNKEKGGVARKNCEVACIGCKKCEKECPFDAIKVEDFCAEIDPEKCKNCGKCYKVCPTGAIQEFVVK